jgi:sec-independent protein translocase protein TatA
MPFRLSPWELGIILVIILIVFGAGKLPEVGANIGKAIRSFKKAQLSEDDKPTKDENVKVLKKGSETIKSS